MKRRNETSILFDFTRLSCGPFKGVPTNLPISPHETGKNAIYLLSAAIKSEEGGAKGRIRVVFDRGYASARETVSLLYENKWRNGDFDYHSGLTWYMDGFESTFTLQNEKSFCESAIWRTVAVLKDLGITKDMFPYPDISQRTVIWVPDTKAFIGPNGTDLISGWLDYGLVLANKLELGRRYAR